MKSGEGPLATEHKVSISATSFLSLRILNTKCLVEAKEKEAKNFREKFLKNFPKGFKVAGRSPPRVRRRRSSSFFFSFIFLAFQFKNP